MRRDRTNRNDEHPVKQKPWPKHSMRTLAGEGLQADLEPIENERSAVGQQGARAKIVLGLPVSHCVYSLVYQNSAVKSFSPACWPGSGNI
jgi:hypothetical protein